MYIQRLFFLLCLGYHLCIKKMKKKHTVLMIHCLKYMKTHHNMSITPFSLGEFIIDDSNKLYRNQ